MINKTFVENPSYFVSQNIKVFKSGTFLDLGGGRGSNSIYLSQKGFDVTNLDKDTQILEIYSSIAQDLNLKPKTINQDLRKINIKKDYDNIITSFTLHFLEIKEGLNVIKKMKTHTSFNGTNLIIGFTATPPFYTETSGLFFLKNNQLLDLYKNWNVLNYEKAVIQTRSGKPQEIAMILAKKIL